MTELAQKQNVGNAGEYYVAARLSALDFVATITLGRAEKYDILALSPKGKTIKISVKTTQHDDSNAFPLSEKDEHGFSNDFYYAFVKLNGFKRNPDMWIVPSKVVSTTIKNAHKTYLNTKGKRGQQRADGSLRILPIEAVGMRQNLYPENWGRQMSKYLENFKQLI